MAITSMGLQRISEGLRTVYMDDIIEQINRGSSPVAAAIEPQEFPGTPNDQVVTFSFGSHGGIGARDELDDLPEASAPPRKQGKFTTKFLTGTMSLTHRVLRGARNNPAALVDELDNQIETLLKDCKEMYSRSFITDHWGVFAKTGQAVSASAVIPVGFGVFSFHENQRIDIVDATTNPITYCAQGRTVEIVDTLNGTVTLDQAVASAPAGAAIVLAESYGKSMTGISEVMNVGTTIYGIDRTVNKWLDPYVSDKTVGGTPSMFDSMWLAGMLNYLKLTSPNPDAKRMFVCTPGVEMAYVEEQNEYKKNIDMMKVEGGYDVPTYNGVPVVTDRFWPSGTMGCIDTSSFRLATMGGDWEFLDEDGAMFKQVPNKAAWVAYVCKYCELLCKVPKSNGIITGIKEIPLS